jgi:hypothetical protein
MPQEIRVIDEQGRSATCAGGFTRFRRPAERPSNMVLEARP